MHNNMIAYLESQRRDSLWSAFLNPLVDEVVASLEKEQTPQLLVKAGMRAAQELPLPHCDAVEQLEHEANHYWTKLGWGLVTFTEQQDCLDIKHECLPANAPQHECFAHFLQGIYQQWFRSAGAGDGLQVKHSGEVQTNVFFFKLAG